MASESHQNQINPVFLRKTKFFSEKPSFSKGAVIKYGTEGGGRDLTGSAKVLNEKCWASKIFQVIGMGHEGICLQYFTIVLKRSSIIFSALLIISIFLHLNFNTVLSSNSSLLS